ncbi:hypothetical protein ISF_06916 [Cordyceps fumosorosea ARSEF 2679]|uniref:Major facilitator superfamily transporter n=1 Tax=Cordyceps fumosorosea (strain ARSEF 2679) TaxID=1081104 RepID=A0A167QIP3_CORFA|nr:hypothetical protein ISF_06916 [Cordyceps fumosorosea ARSEF 2679]OAA57675.1 hypothetical protein ISF_06916 [Cordyceps fumosorosea ARSEF 2679]
MASMTCLLFLTRSTDLRIVSYVHDRENYDLGLFGGTEKPLKIPKNGKIDETTPYWELRASDIKHWSDPDDNEDPNNVQPGTEQDGTPRNADEVSRLQDEKDKRKLWRYLYRATANLKSSNQIYGKTLAALDNRDNRTEEHAEKLVTKPFSHIKVGYSKDEPVYFDPYPNYNSDEWQTEGYAPYVSCRGANGRHIDDIMVFKGRPQNFPTHLMGSYKALNLDPNICWERDTRLGPYGLLEQTRQVGGRLQLLHWDQVDWGNLQRTCVKNNAKRYKENVSSDNPYLAVYPETQRFIPAQSGTEESQIAINGHSKGKEAHGVEARDTHTGDVSPSETAAPESEATSQYKTENRTALLLRSYTGKRYTENDKQTIRALITELALKSGGEYEVFLLVHVKDGTKDVFGNEQDRWQVLLDHVPPEFHGITVLWNDQSVKDIYTEMKDDEERDVHRAQWLSVQKFSYDHPEFEYIWNWEMDFRYTGHHYDLLDNIHKFARKQPRKGLWERNERWYVPGYHGDYDTTFRQSIEQQYGDAIVWGPPDLPFIKPQGPKPPTTPSEDNYEWGVGEDADVITVGPMFNPVNSLWIMGGDIWGYSDETHNREDVPRRTTIVTHSRISKRLLNLMHTENMRGNHVASEMTPQTVALHHGLKAVFAPQPVFMDRQWTSSFVDKWFNAGPGGAAGGYGSAMGWGRERRYQGTTWYYRAEPPNRLFNNWMGWEDTGIGGATWEQRHGRPCLPSIMLHPVKDPEPTKSGHASGFNLGYG